MTLCTGGCGYEIVLINDQDADHDIQILDPEGHVKHQFELPPGTTQALLTRAPCGKTEDWVWGGPAERGVACQLWAWYHSHHGKTLDDIVEEVGISDGYPGT